MEIRDAYIGSDKVARIYTGDKIVHPSPVKEGLVLWYDFMGRKNSDAQRATAEDLSGNGNDGQLVNFAYTAGSGYEEGLEFDGEDDYLQLPTVTCSAIMMHIYIAPDIDQPSLGWSYLFDARNGLANGWYADVNIGTAFIRQFVNGIETPVLMKNIPRGKWTSLYVESNSVFSDNITFMSRFSFQEFTKGRIGQVQLYNRALTPVEIQHNYQMEKERWNL